MSDCRNALAGIFCFGTLLLLTTWDKLQKSQCPCGHFLFWNAAVEVAWEPVENGSQCPCGHFLFWNANGKFRNNASKMEGDFNLLPGFHMLCCQSAVFCVHPLAKGSGKGCFSGGVRYLYPKRRSLSITRRLGSRVFACSYKTQPFSGRFVMERAGLIGSGTAGRRINS